MDFASECYKRASNPINWSGSGKPLSKPLSYKERGFEFSPSVQKKRSILWSPPFEGGRKGDHKGDGRGIIRGTEGGS